MVIMIYLDVLSPGDPPHRAYSHTDVSATFEPEEVTSALASLPTQTRSDLGLGRGSATETGGNREMRITENINTLQSVR